MARYYQPIYYNQNQLIGGVFQTLGAAPAQGAIGQFYYDTVLGAPRFANSGGGWDLLATDSAKLNGQNAAYYRDRANHTGQQTAATISDFQSAVLANPLNTFAVPTGNIAMGGYTLTGLSQTPNSVGQAAEYQWVLNQISAAFTNGIKAVKDPVRVFFANNIAISGVPTSGNADGITLAAGDRVLLNGQTTASQNGIWLVQTGAWTRPIDFDQSNDIETGTEVLVNEGSTYAGTVWRLTTLGSLTLGTSALSWAQVNKVNTYSAGNGLLLTGTSFAVVAAPGGGLVVSGSGVGIDRTIVATKYVQTFGDGAASSFTITHNLATQDVDVTIRDTVTNEIVYPLVTAPTVNTVVVTFTGYVPAANQFRVKVGG